MHSRRSAQLEEEPVARLLWSFSLPAIVGLLSQALYNAIDRIFVGQAMGDDAIAGVAVAFPFTLILVAFGQLFGFGAGALVSLRLGEGDRLAAERILGHAAALLVLTAVILTPLAFFTVDPLLQLFGASPDIMPYARPYLQIIILGSVSQLLSFGLNAVIRGEGNPRVAMLTMLISVALNAVLAPLFIFGFGWGMRGAAWATVFSQTAAAVWVAAYFFSAQSLLKLRIPSLRLHGSVCRQILFIGSPMCAVQLAATVLLSVMYHQLNRYGGDLAISVMGIVYVWMMLIAMPVFGVNQGAQPIIGYNYGAKRYDRVKKTLLTAILAASAITVIGFLVTNLFPTSIIRLFDRENPDLAELGAHALHVALAMMPIIGFQVVSANYFQAVGKPLYALLLTLSRQVLLLFPALYILPCFFQLDGVWLSLPASDFLSSLLTGACLLRELGTLRRKEKRGALRDEISG
jgi:putative MATE family efflux protein